MKWIEELDADVPLAGAGPPPQGPSRAPSAPKEAALEPLDALEDDPPGASRAGRAGVDALPL
jgi:hypothetical protein